MSQLDIFSLEGRVAIVAGGGGAIGAALAEALAGAGARVAVAGRTARRRSTRPWRAIRAAGSEGLAVDRGCHRRGRRRSRGRRDRRGVRAGRHHRQRRRRRRRRRC